MPVEQPERIVSQTGKPRCVVVGKRTGGGESGPCTIIAEQARDGVDLYPHGATQLAVHLTREAAAELGDFLARRRAA